MIINILDSFVHNKIAAGEVIENPSSVVKELVDNSIDAGGNRIVIEIMKGGIKAISVTDNGSGLLSSEIEKSILPHATSKISKAEDLFSLSSLGFRGEALASISSVSDFYIRTKHYSEEMGSFLSIENGLLKIEKFAWEGGTSVAVNNLFYNTPARYKFLGSILSEENNIKKLIYKYILANPFISISLIIDEKVIYSSSGDGLLSACEAVLDKEISSQLIHFEDFTDSIKISGYISPPSLYKGNRNYQTIVVNGRVISDVNLSATIHNAFSGVLMKHSFPIFIINLLIPFKEVDVNVHPAKKEVRFSNPRAVYGKIYKVIKMTIDEHVFAAQSQIFSNQPQKHYNEDLAKKNPESKESSKEKPELTKVDKCKGQEELIQKQDNEFKEQYKYSKESFIEDTTFSPSKAPECLIRSDLEGEAISSREKRINSDHNFYENERLFPPSDKSLQDTVEFQELKDFEYKVVGQVFGTYLIIETGKFVVIFDQHAFHEKVLYENYLSNINDKKGSVVSQNLLIPYIVDCGSSTQKDLLLNAKEELASIGFHIEDFGQSIIRVTAVPLEFAHTIDFKVFFEIFINEIGNNLQTTIADKLLHERMASIACKSAIKGNTPLSHEQILSVIKYFFNSNKPLFCPHGRPTFISLERKDFDKMFRRIK